MQPPFSRTAFELLSEQAGRCPDALAVISAARRSHLCGARRRSASSVAPVCARMAIKRGDAVGLLCSNRIEWLEIFFGASALGAIVVPFSTWSTPASWTFLLRDSGVRCLFTLTQLR